MDRTCEFEIKIFKILFRGKRWENRIKSGFKRSHSVFHVFILKIGSDNDLKRIAPDSSKVQDEHIYWQDYRYTSFQFLQYKNVASATHV